ncbi:MAG: hypothetical protein QM657_14995 [Lacrimispora sp.]|uniref:hypothetical protein n=1 Tax=Lacrimispora sp. TaxID=2719234 RepID=UPI0039E66211
MPAPIIQADDVAVQAGQNWKKIMKIAGFNGVCNKLVYEIFKFCGAEMDAVTVSDSALPIRAIQVMHGTQINRVGGSLDISSTVFHKGDVVAFYKTDVVTGDVNRDRMSHVMIAVDDHTLSGLNNTSTFPDVPGGFYILDMGTYGNKIKGDIRSVGILSAQQFVNYHFNEIPGA